MARKKWRWLWLDDQTTSLQLLIRILNLRLKQLGEFLDDLLATGSGKIEFYFHNDGAVLIPGESDWGYIDIACLITGAQLVTDPAGSLAVQVYTSRYPVWDVWTLISAAGPITLVSADKAQPSVGGWSVDLTAGTYMKVVIVGAPSAIRKATLTLFVEPV